MSTIEQGLLQLIIGAGEELSLEFLQSLFSFLKTKLPVAPVPVVPAKK